MKLRSNIVGLDNLRVGGCAIARSHPGLKIGDQRVFETLSAALSRPGLKIGANGAKSTEGTHRQIQANLQSVETDFVPLDRDFESRAGWRFCAEIFSSIACSNDW